MVEYILKSHYVGNLQTIFHLRGFDLIPVVFVKIIFLRLASVSMIQLVPIEGLFVDVEDAGLDEFYEKSKLVYLQFNLRTCINLLRLLLLDKLRKLRIVLHVKKHSNILGEQILAIGSQ